MQMIRAICYGGRNLKPNETKYSVSELECLTISEAIREYRHCLLQVVTDHRALTYLNTAKLINARIYRRS
jgi:hypothetical protein